MRRTFIILAGFLGVILLGVLGLYSARGSLLDGLIRAELEALGIEDARFALAESRWGYLRLEAVRLGAVPPASPETATDATAPLQVQTLTLTFDLESLIDSRLRTVRVEGLRLRGRYDDEQGVSLGGLERLMGQEATPPASEALFPLTPIDTADLPLDELVVSQSRMLLQTPSGPAELGFSGSLRSARASLIGKADFDLVLPKGTVQGEMLWHSQAEGGLNVELSVQEGQLAINALTFKDLSGNLAFSNLKGDGPDLSWLPLSIKGHLRADTEDSQGRPLGQGSLAVVLNAQEAKAQLSFASKPEHPQGPRATAEAALVLSGLSTNPALGLDGQITLPPEGRLRNTAALFGLDSLPEASGRIAFSFKETKAVAKLFQRLPQILPPTDTLLSQAALQGRISLALQQIDLPGWLEGGRVTGEMRLGSEASKVTLTADRDWHFSADRLDPTVIEALALPPILVEVNDWLSQPFQITLGHRMAAEAKPELGPEGSTALSGAGSAPAPAFPEAQAAAPMAGMGSNASAPDSARAPSDKAADTPALRLSFNDTRRDALQVTGQAAIVAQSSTGPLLTAQLSGAAQIGLGADSASSINIDRYEVSLRRMGFSWLDAGVLAFSGALRGDGHLLTGPLSVSFQADRFEAFAMAARDPSFTWQGRFQSEPGWQQFTPEQPARFTASGFAVTPVAIKSLEAELPFSLVVTPNTLDVSLDWSGSAEAESVLLAPGLELTALSPLKLVPAPQPLLTINATPESPAPEIALALETALESANLRIDSESGPTFVKLSAPLMRLSGRKDRQDQVFHGEISLEDGTAALPEQDLALLGIGLRSRLASPGPAVPVTDIHIAALAEDVAQPLLAPPELELHLRPDGEDGMKFKGKVRAGLGRMQAPFTGNHSLATGRGRLDWHLQPVTFTPKGLQPTVLIPSLKRDLTQVGGTLRASGYVAWHDAGGMRGGANIDLNGLSGRLGTIRFSGLDSRLHFPSLQPLSTAKDQKLTIRTIDIGLPFLNTEARFQWRRDGKLALSRLTTHFAQGTLSASEVVIDPSQDSHELTLAVKDMSLADLVALAEQPELSATGRLSGRIPLRLQDGDVAITDGLLRATGSGTIRYQSEGEESATAAAGGQSMGMALEALQDFRYKNLTATLDRAFGGETKLQLSLSGSNPSFYDGYPVEFNLGLSGKLDQILRQSLSGYQMPDRVRQRFDGN